VNLGDLTAALAEKAAGYDESGAFPYEGIRLVHEAGLLVPSGGPGELARVLIAIGRGDPSVALIASMTQVVHLLQAMRPTWPAALYEQVLASSAVRPTLLNTCRVEPDLGSPSRGGLPSTVARRTASGWVVNGRKRFVTGAEGLSYFLVWAATDEPSPRVGNFVVSGDEPGIELVRTWNQLGLRASGSHDVVLTDAAAVDVIDLGPPGPPDNLAGGALHLPLAAIYLGVARAAQEAFHRFAHARVPSNLGRPVATTDRFKTAAGEIEILLDTAERLVLTATADGTMADGTMADGAMAARVIANRHAVQAVTIAVRLLGNPGLSRDNPLERHFRDVQTALVHAPQEDLALLAVGAAALSR
jgi:alkylation response protein AidB-like acyl-CoA dehydrogenase